LRSRTTSVGSELRATPAPNFFRPCRTVLCTSGGGAENVTEIRHSVATWRDSRPRKDPRAAAKAEGGPSAQRRCYCSRSERGRSAYPHRETLGAWHRLRDPSTRVQVLSTRADPPVRDGAATPCFGEPRGQRSSLHGHSGFLRASSRHFSSASRDRATKGIGFGEGLGPSQDTAVGFSLNSVEAQEFAIARAVGFPDHAAALIDGHVVQDADRLASRRARRAASARDVSSPGTASPLPKYISSGVWPRNAECGRT
jgi:hypothetical protein